MREVTSGGMRKGKMNKDNNLTKGFWIPHTLELAISDFLKEVPESLSNRAKIVQDILKDYKDCKDNQEASERFNKLAVDKKTRKDKYKFTIYAVACAYNLGLNQKFLKELY